ncbi:glycoside hydrolase family 17 protein [Aplosporella prunicola CBS 121167]|uniref:Glycoside hydrolase family 17 protein n=1 Tax=Aplosporella prunicola CBS 121167 TaxID=1176127 RepID=A0A6A6BMT8_9PEZI|nr:glycoside hydrolase family 17 protein [Aplosporella prunicola CBS 121167]KAF2144723.1 glycoside hydrolase family 17 protein [Aplosporella prunicola CBS 121167]
MKTGFFSLAAASLLGMVAARPYHTHDLAERALVTAVEVVTVTTPAVVVHVQGTKTWTVTNQVQEAAATTTQFVTTTVPVASVPTPSSSAVKHTSTVAVPTSADVTPVANPGPSSDAGASTTKAKPTSQPVASPKPQSSVVEQASSKTSVPQESAAPKPAPPDTDAAAASSGGFGISYNPYSADGTCKSSAQVSSDIDKLTDYGLIRIYGTDCNQLDTVIPAVQEHPGMKLFLGINNIDTATSEASMVVSAAKKYLNGNWGTIDTVSVGNEAVTNGMATVSGVVSAINSVRSTLRDAGYKGPVVTVETVGAIIDTADGSGLELCKASDYTAANCHAFFDTSGYYSSGNRAGDFVEMQHQRLVKACGNSRTVITESGWPHGSSMALTEFGTDAAIPDEQNHVAAIKSLRKAFQSNPEDLVLFSAFDDRWKKDNAGTKGAEGYWGINH